MHFGYLELIIRGTPEKVLLALCLHSRVLTEKIVRVASEIKMLSKEVKWCSIDNWYAKFKKVTFKTLILPIPNDVLEYLRSDGSLILPKAQWIILPFCCSF